MSYLLYAGNMLFAGCIAVFIWFYSKKRMDNPSAGSMVLAGNIATVTGVIMACIISLVLLLVIAPGAFNGATQTDVLKQAPSQLQGKNRGFIIILFMNAVIGNASAGAFISIILPYIAKRDQKGDTSQTKNKFN